MIDKANFKMTWALLTRRERRNAGIVMLIVMISSLSAVMMVASIMPFLSVLSDPEQIQTSKTLSWFYEVGGFKSDYDFLFALGLGSITVIILSNLMQIFKIYAISRYTSMRVFSISTRLLENYAKQPYLYFISHRSSDLNKQILGETQILVERSIRPIFETVAAIMTVTLILMMLLYLEPVISIITMLAIGSIYGMTGMLSRKWTKSMGEIRAKTNTQRYQIANETLTGIKDIKLLGREHYYVDRFSEPSKLMAQSMSHIAVAGQGPQYVIQGIMFAGIIILCLFLIASSGIGDKSDITDLVPTIGLLALAGQRILPELSRFFSSITAMSFAGPALKAIYNDLVVEKIDGELPREPSRPLGLKSALTFENVSFRYPDAEKGGLSEISFEIKAGERIGIVGATGSGKSTIANLILGLIEPSRGRLMVDGKQLTKDNIRSWQRSIGYVPQDIFLCDLSVRENIALGVAPDQIDDERVKVSARTARVHDFIVEQLDSGYDTLVGERGVRLSGGQRQRLGIARALYNEADLILFDEATSALDNATEKEVMQSIDALSGDKTLVMIAHRLSTLRNCDRLLVLRQGQVVAFDSWANLERDSVDFQAMTAATKAF